MLNAISAGIVSKQKQRTKTSGAQIQIAKAKKVLATLDKPEKKIRLIFGKRGCGKTELAKQLCQDCERLLIYDTLGEYRHGVVISNLQELKEFWGKVYRCNFRIIYQPLDPDSDFDPICNLVNTLQRRPAGDTTKCEDLTFLVEELDRYSKPLSLSLPSKEIIQWGRHRNIELIGISQRPHGIDRLITSQAKEMYIFNTTEPRDVDYFKDVVGYDVVVKIADLKEYEYVRWQDGINELEIGKEKIRKLDDLTESPDE